MYGWIIFLVLVALVCVALFKESRLLRISLLVVLVMVLLFRELSIDLILRTKKWERDTQELTREQYEQYNNGAHAIVDYCQETRLFYIGISFLLVLHCIRGYKRTKLKANPETKSS